MVAVAETPRALAAILQGTGVFQVGLHQQHDIKGGLVLSYVLQAVIVPGVNSTMGVRAVRGRCRLRWARAAPGCDPFSEQALGRCAKGHPQDRCGSDIVGSQ